MYESFYNLRGKPFALLPDSEFLYLGETHRTAHSLLEYGLLSEAPFIVLTGETGMGKTSLLQKIIAEHREKYAIGFVTNARYDVDHLLPWILLALGLSQKQLDPVEAYHTLSEFLTRESKCNRRVVLIVDEAQSLGVELLEELRLLSNMNDGKILKLQLILSGQPDLHTLLQRIDMTQFAQRIVVDYHLKSLTEEEVLHYIQHRVQVAGGKPSLFTAPACSLAYRLSKGIPRLINQVCEMGLTYGFAEGARRVTAKLLALAALDRQKSGILPVPVAREDLLEIVSAPEETEELSKLASSASFLTEPFSDNSVSTITSEQSYQTGLALRQSRDFKAAIDQFEQAAEDSSYHLKAFAQSGLCYNAIGQSQQAVQAFRKALADHSASLKERLSVRYLLGRTLESQGQIADALEAYRRIRREDPGYRDAGLRIEHLSNGRSRAHVDKSWMSQALTSLQRFLGS